jgi:hypothetical protein
MPAASAALLRLTTLLLLALRGALCSSHQATKCRSTSFKIAWPHGRVMMAELFDSLVFQAGTISRLDNSSTAVVRQCSSGTAAMIQQFVV